MITEQELAGLESLAKAATPGPWTANCDYVNNTEGFVCNTATPEDADFVAAAREALPKLIAEVRRLQAIEAAASEIQRADPYHRAPNIRGTSMCDAMDGLYKLLDARETTS